IFRREAREVIPCLIPPTRRLRLPKSNGLVSFSFDLRLSSTSPLHQRRTCHCALITSSLEPITAYHTAIFTWTTFT
ncbi:hypothetical protein BDN72DRAFT_964542, partial [Pluteus cervinus]